MPSPTDSDPCGSKSTRSTFRPYSASAAPRLIVVVVLPTPPFWLHIETTRAGPWWVTGSGSGMSIIGRPGGTGRALHGGNGRRGGLLLRGAGAGGGSDVVEGWGGRHLLAGLGGDRTTSGFLLGPMVTLGRGHRTESSTSSSLPGYPALIQRPPGCLPRDSVALDVDRYICRGNARDSMHLGSRSQRHRADDVDARRIWGLRVCSSGGECTGTVRDVDEPVHAAAFRSGYSSALGCAAAYTSRRLSTVTRV